MRALRTYIRPKTIPGDRSYTQLEKLQALSWPESKSREQSASSVSRLPRPEKWDGLNKTRRAEKIRAQQVRDKAKARKARAAATEEDYKQAQMGLEVSDRVVWWSGWVDDGKGRKVWSLKRIS